MKNLWHTFYWKHWNTTIYHEYITTDDLPTNKSPQLYNKVFVFDEEQNEMTEKLIPMEHQKVVFVRKKGSLYILPLVFEQQIPVKPMESFECLEKKSNKNLHNFVTSVKSVSVPSDSKGTGFREWVDNLNPIKHTNELHMRLMKLLVVASAYSGVGVGVCSPPEFSKGVFFSLFKYMGTTISFLKAPTEAYLYQCVCANKVLVFDEITTAPSEKVSMIENLVINLKDNTPELPKQALTKGYQKRSADLTSMSAIFTFNRPQDLKRGKPFEEVWGNPAAIKSRFPLFLFDGKVDQAMDNPSPHEMEVAIKEHAQFFKDEMMKAKYWTTNIHLLQKDFNRSNVKLQGRHYTNSKAWYDVIEAYCETQTEFDLYVSELNRCNYNYSKMIKGQAVQGETDNKIKPTIEEVNMVELI
jgi:hypothetical protein